MLTTSHTRKKAPPKATLAAFGSSILADEDESVLSDGANYASDTLSNAIGHDFLGVRQGGFVLPRRGCISSSSVAFRAGKTADALAHTARSEGGARAVAGVMTCATAFSAALTEPDIRGVAAADVVAVFAASGTAILAL